MEDKHKTHYDKKLAEPGYGRADGKMASHLRALVEFRDNEAAGRHKVGGKPRAVQVEYPKTADVPQAKTLLPGEFDKDGTLL